MSEAIITVENLGKKYRLSHQGERPRYVALRDVLAQKFSAPWKFLRGVGSSKIADRNSTPSPNSHLRSPTSAPTSISSLPSSRASREDFWALKDVSFQVQRGEVVGIIGRNGAGKSTLLKILSRITEPTTGRVHLRGRVASLLEVGTGFHPELTGRENVFLNGAILGMSQAEVRQKFDEIVAFAEVEKFLDTPVKRYSSGMYVRLAFAVAAHLEPEILIVDEVLAVGDSEFQKKCMGKMKDVAGNGRTVLFVSHNMLAVQKLCKTGLLFEKGVVIKSGTIDSIVADYASTGATDVYSKLELSGKPEIVAATILTLSRRTNAHLEVMVEWVLPEDIAEIKIGIGFSTPEGQRIFDCPPEDYGLITPSTKGRHKAVIKIPPNTLMAKHYNIGFGLWKNSTVFDFVNPALTISIEPTPSGPYTHENTREGLVNIGCQWKILE